MAMTGRGRLVVLPVDNGTVGPLDGPFTLAIESEDCAKLHGAEAETLAMIVAFVRLVARGVSCYSGNDFENSSNLTSYASECMSDLRSDAPDAAAQLESLVVDCSGLTAAIKMHPIWKLDRAILRALPGVTFIE